MPPTHPAPPDAQAPAALTLMGMSLPPYGGPFMTGVQITLESAKAKPDKPATPGKSGRGPGTRFRLADHSFGKVDAGTRASLSDGWRQLFDDALRAYVEK